MTSTRTLLVGTAAALLLSGCGGYADPGPTGQAAATPEPSDSVTMIQPGEPGEDNATIGPDDLPEETAYSHADVAFVQMMIPHHAQALQMTALADTRASSPAVKSLARRIEGAQGPEILTLAAWLQARKLEVPRRDQAAEDFDHSKHGHMAMEGMLTRAQMKQLAGLEGTAFDRMFLQRMIGHHAGAVHMAEEVAVDGTDVQVNEMAAEVQAGQQSEIDRMRQMLKDL